jgi:hypothetical protein
MYLTHQFLFDYFFFNIRFTQSSIHSSIHHAIITRLKYDFNYKCCMYCRSVSLAVAAAAAEAKALAAEA